MWQRLLLVLLVACPAEDKPDASDDSGPGASGESGESTVEAPVSVTVSAEAATAAPLESVQLTATVENAASNAVTWAVASGPGAVDEAGLYTADEETGAAVVAACSVEDPSACGSAEIVVARGGTLQRSKRVDHSYADDIHDVEATADGIIGLGETYEDQTYAHNQRAWVVPWTWSGALDSGLGGAQWFDYNNDGCQAQDASLDEDGRLVVLGDYRSDPTAFLMRLESDGDLDDSFGEDGEQELDELPFDELTIDAEGGYLVGGDALLRRYTAEGEVDAAWGDGGDVQLELPADDAARYGEVRLIDLQRSGDATVLLASADNALVYGRFDLDGQPDTAVSATGLAVFRTLSDDDLGPLNGFALDADGRMLVAWGDPDEAEVSVAAVLPDGTLDTGFGRRGVASASFDDPDSEGDFNFDACCTAVDERGRVVVAGQESPHLLVTRFTADGELDPAWGDDQNLYVDQVGEVDVVGAAVGPTGVVAVVAVVDDVDEDDADAILYLFDP